MAPPAAVKSHKLFKLSLKGDKVVGEFQRQWTINQSIINRLMDGIKPLNHLLDWIEVIQSSSCIGFQGGASTSLLLNWFY